MHNLGKSTKAQGLQVPLMFTCVYTFAQHRHTKNRDIETVRTSNRNVHRRIRKTTSYCFVKIMLRHVRPKAVISPWLKCSLLLIRRSS